MQCLREHRLYKSQVEMPLHIRCKFAQSLTVVDVLHTVPAGAWPVREPGGGAAPGGGARPAAQPDAGVDRACRRDPRCMPQLAESLPVAQYCMHVDVIPRWILPEYFAFCFTTACILDVMYVILSACSVVGAMLQAMVQQMPMPASSRSAPTGSACTGQVSSCFVLQASMTSCKQFRVQHTCRDCRDCA